MCGLACIVAVLQMAIPPDTSWRFKMADRISNFSATSNLLPDLGNGIIQNAVCANLPQLILTLLYMTYNNLYTRKAVAHEWDQMAIKASPLRVTDPQGEQNSTRYLGLPFRFAIPLQIISSVLHWLISQAIFVTSFAVFNYDDFPVVVDRDGHSIRDPARPAQTPDQIIKEGANEFVRVGYSCLALSIFTGILFICFIVSAGDNFRTVHSHMPRVKTCSAALAASCGKTAMVEEQLYGKIQWGVVAFRNGVAECGFTDTPRTLSKLEDRDLLAKHFLCWNKEKWKVGKVPLEMLRNRSYPQDLGDPHLTEHEEVWESLRKFKRTHFDLVQW